MDIQVLGDRQQDALSSIETGVAEQFTGSDGSIRIHRLAPIANSSWQLAVSKILNTHIVFDFLDECIEHATHFTELSR
jgi:hypothetical protein